MQGKRVDRVGHLIQMELSQVILTKIKDPRLGFVTITHVTMAPDLKQAFVFYSVMGDHKAKEDSRLALEKAKGYLQHQIAEAIKMRFTPRLEFRLDDSLDRGLEIDRVLREIKKEQK